MWGFRKDRNIEAIKEKFALNFDNVSLFFPTVTRTVTQRIVMIRNVA